jgi:heptosyltransferase-1
LRTSALGDVVHALPALIELRRALPEATLGWAVEAAFAPLLAGHPGLDRLVEVRLRGGGPRAFAAAVRAVRRFAPDIALDLMGNHKAGALARLSGARRVIGLGRRWRREPSSAMWMTETAAPRGPHAVDRALAPLAALGLPGQNGDPGFGGDFGGAAILPGESAATAERIAAAGLAEAADPGGPGFAVLHPGAGWANKVYPPARWGEVARRLERAAGLPTAVAVAPGEEALAAAVVAAGGGAVRPVPAPDLPALAALLRRARLVLGGDTGPIHLAHALGVPVVCLLGPTDPERNGPYRAPAGALAVRLPCSFCYKRFDDARPCLLAIPAEAVAARALELLALPSGSR